MRYEFETIDEYRLSLSHWGDWILLLARESGELILRVDLRFTSRPFSDSNFYAQETSGYTFNYGIIYLDKAAYDRYVDLLRNESPVRVQIVWDESAWSGSPTNATYEVTAFHLTTLDEPVGEEESS